jgi:hypothetical protein
LRLESSNFLLAVEYIDLCIANLGRVARAQETNLLVWDDASIIESDGDKVIVDWWGNAMEKGGMDREGLWVWKAPVEGLHCVRPG